MLAGVVSHCRWANRAWLEFIAGTPSSDEWLWQRLSHILLGERAWFQRIHGDAPDRQIWTRLPHPELERLADAHDRLYAECLAGDLARVIAFQRFTGEKGQLPIADILTHLVLHGAHHRGQMATHASALGLTPINTDFVRYSSLTQP
jgi:uncharacterized damage-inducible protein DinB